MVTPTEPSHRAAPSSYWLDGFARHATGVPDSDDREQTHQWYTALLAPYVPPDAQWLLDIGCGRGRVIRALAELAPNARCIGIDGNEATLAAAKRELDSETLAAELHRIDVTEPGFMRTLASRGIRFDVITSMFVLHHYPPQTAGEILHQLRSLLLPSGVIILAEAHDPNAADAVVSEQICAQLATLAGDAPDTLWTEAEVRTACRLGGFEDGTVEFVAAVGWPFTETEAIANRQALHRLWSGVQAAEEQLASPHLAERIATLKRVVAKMCEHRVARPARFGPLLAILRLNNARSLRR